MLSAYWHLKAPAKAWMTGCTLQRQLVYFTPSFPYQYYTMDLAKKTYSFRLRRAAWLSMYKINPIPFKCFESISFCWKSIKLKSRAARIEVRNKICVSSRNSTCIKYDSIHTPVFHLSNNRNNSRQVDVQALKPQAAALPWFVYKHAHLAHALATGSRD